MIKLILHYCLPMVFMLLHTITFSAGSAWSSLLIVIIDNQSVLWSWSWNNRQQSYLIKSWLATIHANGRTEATAIGDTRDGGIGRERRAQSHIEAMPESALTVRMQECTRSFWLTIKVDLGRLVHYRQYGWSCPIRTENDQALFLLLMILVIMHSVILLIRTLRYELGQTGQSKPWSTSQARHLGRSQLGYEKPGKAWRLGIPWEGGTKLNNWTAQRGARSPSSMITPPDSRPFLENWIQDHEHSQRRY